LNIGITCYPTVGGSGAVAAELGKQLARRGHNVHFVSYRLPFRLGGFQENVCFHEVDVTTYALFEYPPHDLALAAKMAEVSRAERLDLLHVHYAIPHAIAGFLAQAMLGDGAPRLVTTLHGTDITLVGQDPSFIEITRFGIERSDGVTAVSDFLRRMTAEEFGVTRPIEVIPNFVDIARHCAGHASCARDAFAAPGERILLHMSNFRPVKRVADIVRVFERVNREVPSVLLMAGDGPERASAQALARRLGVADRVRFLGRQDEVEELTAIRSSSRSVSRPSRPWPAAWPSSAATPAACRRSSSRVRPATCFRSATSRAWPRAPPRSCATTSADARWDARRAGAPARCSIPGRSSRNTNASTSACSPGAERKERPCPPTHSTSLPSAPIRTTPT